MDLLGARNGFAGLVSLAQRFGSGRITKSSLLGEIAAHQGVAGFWCAQTLILCDSIIARSPACMKEGALSSGRRGAPSFMRPPFGET